MFRTQAKQALPIILRENSVQIFIQDSNTECMQFELQNQSSKIWTSFNTRIWNDTFMCFVTENKLSFLIFFVFVYLPATQRLASYTW